MARFAVLSYHTSPLAQPGVGDGGGMNVYVRELSIALARQGHDVDVYTRADDGAGAAEVAVEPGLRVWRVPAGPARPLSRTDLPAHVDEFTAGVRDRLAARPRVDAIHANYWLSGKAGHALKHELGVPLLTTFHTLERVRAATFEAESIERAEEERRIIGCSDAVLASCDVEASQLVRDCGAPSERVHVVPLGVEHAIFGPGHRPQARRALGLPADVPLVLFVGRLQELKGVDLALEAFIELRRRGQNPHLAIVGGPSGPSGLSTAAHLRERVAEEGVGEMVTFVEPQPHELLSTWYRAADVTVVPSRAESFGLVALESQACGTPVVAARVGGLTTLVRSGSTGWLVDSRSPGAWADALSWALAESRTTLLSTNAVLAARAYTWRAAAEQVAALAETLARAELVACS